MGIRYRAMLPTGGLEDMPSAAKATCLASFDNFRRLDRGAIRRGNDQTMDTRAAYFRKWLLSPALGYSDFDLHKITPSQGQALIMAYAENVAFQHINLHGLNLQSKSVSGYINAAHQWLELHTAQPGKIVIHAGAGKSRQFISCIQEMVDQKRAWGKPREKREPYTFDMFLYMEQEIATMLDRGMQLLLDQFAAVYDWARLGVFTGSRVGEYAQTKSRLGEYLKVPNNPAAGDYAGQPIAFISDDFTFLDASSCILSHRQVVKKPGSVAELHIRFRYDKSKNNFVIRKFRSGNSFLCPLRAAISIICRAQVLKVPKSEPLGVYRTNKQGKYTFLKSAHVIAVMRKVCLNTYTDPMHFMRINFKRIVAHSNRVTAAVALQNQGLKDEEIAFRLRWNKESVIHYLRESSQRIGPLTIAAIQGACLI